MYRGLLIIFLFCISLSRAQNTGRQIQIRQAESLSFDKERNNAKILRGNVICEHEGALLHCDTAYIYDLENKMVARGHILITKGDSIRVTGENLVYEGKTRLATLQGNVKCVEKDMTLTTNILTFDVARSVANYYNGGTLVNRENTLVSRNGHYYSATKEASFHYDVVLTNPDYRMNSDTLRYRITNKTSYFLGPSIITSKEDYIYCENGWYDTEKEKSQFSRNAVLVTKNQKLRGDSLLYDRIKKTGRAFRNITLIDTSQKSIITGNYAEYHQDGSEALVTGKATYARAMDKDTLWLAADTLYHKDLDSVNRFLNAFHHVKVYRRDIQAICDSAVFASKDSLMNMYGTPVLWNGQYQATAKLIRLRMGQNQVKGFVLEGRAFLSQDADTIRHNKFNQLAGRQLEGTISNDSIRKVIVTGNAEIFYFPKNKEKLIGLNKTTCAEINLWFKNGDIDRITMKPQTKGQVDPMKTVDLENARLKGFSWQQEKRPRSRRDLYKR